MPILEFNPFKNKGNDMNKEKNKCYLDDLFDGDYEDPNFLPFDNEFDDRVTPSVVYRLHLEIEGSALNNMSEEDASAMRKKGKASHAIFRDVLVPDNLTLSQLHFLIQRAFGWRNEGLYRFSLPDKEYNELLKNSVKKWTDLCGVYFRFPYNDISDLRADDDYEMVLAEKGVSSYSYHLADWFKDKYTTDYPYLGVGDKFIANDFSVANFYKNYPGFKSCKEGLDEAQEVLEDTGSCNHLLSTLRLRDLLYDKRDCCEGYYADDYEKFLPIEEDVAEASVKYIQDMTRLTELEDKAEELERKNEKLQRRKKSKNFMNEFAELDRQATELMFEMAELYEKMEDDEAIIAFERFSITDSLIYEYGEDYVWKVKIDCTDAYFQGEEIASYLIEFYNQAGEKAIGTIFDGVFNVYTNCKPVAIAADGVNVFENDGGIQEYIDFLKCICIGGSLHASVLKKQAKEKGWTGLQKKPKNIL